MKKLIKKSLLNGFMRIILILVQNIISKFKENNNVGNNKTIESIIFNNIPKEKKLAINLEKKIGIMRNQKNKSDDLKQKYVNYEIKTKYSYYNFNQKEIIYNNLNNSNVGKENLKDFQSLKDNSLTKIVSDLDRKNQTIASTLFSVKRYYKCKAIIFCVLIVIGYVSLNNYLIMLVYYKSNSAKFSSSSYFSSSSIRLKYSDSSLLFNMKPLASIFNKYSNDNYINKNMNHLKNDNYEIDDITYTYDTFYKLNESDYIVNIDPEDLEVANLKIEKIFNNKENYKLLSESYFEESYVLTKNSSNIQSSKILDSKYFRPCVHPKLNPFDSDIMKFFKKEQDLRCNPKKNWIYIENGRLRVSKAAINKHGTIVCAYIPL